jgi:uncharacterized membrane protein YfcA
VAAGILAPFALLGGLVGRPIGDRLGSDGFALLTIALLTAAGLYTVGRRPFDSPTMNISTRPTGIDK